VTLDTDLLAFALRRVGWPGFAALAILAASAWGEWVYAPAIASDAAALHAQALQERERKTVARPVDAAKETLAAVYARLPDDRLSNATLAAFLQAAKAQGLVVDAVQFRTESSRLPGVVRHQVQVPIKGQYGALRSWLSTTLHEHPGVSLDSLEIKRKDALTSELEANLTLSLWASTLRSNVATSVVSHGG
jgi:hypothetical protein